MKKEYYTDFSLSYRSFLPSPVFLQRRDFFDLIASKQDRILSGTFLSIHFSIFFSRNDVSGQCLRGAEGESSPQSPPAGAFLKKKRKKEKKEEKKKIRR